MSDIAELEKCLLGLLRGEYSSLTISMNDGPAIHYMTVKEWVEEGPPDSDGGWINEEEKQKAIKNNRMWTLHWYPDTPVGLYEISASTLEAVIAEACK